MPELFDGISKKRKRKLCLVHAAESASRVSNKHDEILLLETQILQSRRHYNSIITLLGYVKEPDPQNAENQKSVAAAVALCRVFCRLIALGNMSKSRETSEDETLIVQWLIERLQEYQSALLFMLASRAPSISKTALTLLMRLIKEGDMQRNVNVDAIWCNGVFPNILQTLVNLTAVDDARSAFVDEYFVKYHDIRYHSLTRLR